VSGGRRQRIVISNFDSPGNPHYDGGGAAVMEMIAQRLADEFEVTFLTAAHRGQVSGNARFRYRHLPVRWAGPRGGQLAYHALLPLAARRIPHDLWIEGFTPPWSTSFLPLASSGRVVGIAHALSGVHMWERYHLPFFLVERLGLRCYRDLVVLNQADAEQAKRLSPAASVRVIPNGTVIPGLSGQPDGSGEHILFLGRVDVWHKGLDILISGYQRSGVKLPLVIAGNGTPGEEAKLSALVKGAKSGVRWVGRVTGKDKQDLLSRCAFLVMPSRTEAFGIAALEAMAWGKPILHFTLPTLDWINGGISVGRHDVSALARAIGDLAGDAGLRAKLGGEARAAAESFSVDRTAERYLDLVRELLGSPQPGRSAMPWLTSKPVSGGAK
jgi:glycosyltransferase involved in cell wall biosynthesis